MLRELGVGSGQWAVKSGGREPLAETLRVAALEPTTKSMPHASSLPTANCLLPTRRPRRRGISLLEVLISMFVLLFGLMGVAAIFPVGNHYAGRAEQYDRSSALIDQAFAEIKARGMMNPTTWLYPEPADNSTTGGATNSRYEVVVPANVLNGGWFNYRLNAGNFFGPGHAFVIDPLGAGEARELTTARRGVDVFPFAYMGGDFPDGISESNGREVATNTLNPDAWRNGPSKLYGTRWPIRRITLPGSDPTQPPLSSAVPELLSMLHDDLASSLPEEDDRPGVQQWAANNNGTPNDPTDDVLLKRQFTGSYSWIATVVPTSADNSSSTPDALQAMQPNEPLYGTFAYDVSVAVFYKRDSLPSAASERSIDAQLLPGNELVLYGSEAAIDAATADIRPGQWIALTGVHPTKEGVFLLKWYRLLSLDNETDTTTGPGPLRRATLDGPEWPVMLNAAGTPIYPIENLRAIIMPGVIGVSTQQLYMEPVN